MSTSSHYQKEQLVWILLKATQNPDFGYFFFWTFTPFSYFKKLFSSSRILNVKATEQKKKTGAGKTCPTKPLVWGVNVSPP